MYPTPDPEHLGYGFPDPDAPLPRSARHPRRGMSPGRKRIVTTLAVLTFLAVPAIAGYQVGKDNNGSPVATAPLGTDGTVAPTPSDGSSTLPGRDHRAPRARAARRRRPPSTRRRSRPRSTTSW